MNPGGISTMSQREVARVSSAEPLEPDTGDVHLGPASESPDDRACESANGSELLPREAAHAAQPGAPSPAEWSLRGASAASTEFLALIPHAFARRHVMVSQGTRDGIEHLAVSERTDRAAIFNVGVRLGRAVRAQRADPEAIARIIDEAYGRRSSPIGRSLGPTAASAEASGSPPESATIEALISAADRDLLSTSGKGPVTQLVDSLLFDALGRSASDLHIQPLEVRTLVRIRIDGLLHDRFELPRSLTSAVLSRIKVMGRMDIADRRIPQDGRASVTIGERSIDVRISTLPTSHGERAVLRLLDAKRQPASLDNLGMTDELCASYLVAADRSHGLLLVTGPTGSGKTTTLYATLLRVGRHALNVMTIEDPIEYELSGLSPDSAVSSIAGGNFGPTEGAGRQKLAISQSQVNAKKGVTFANGLRHILRQDPDVIMVGEIRDVETARMAVQASLTGHMVFSTLHTNDAASAVMRMIDLGVEAFLLASSLTGVLAQRLLRLVHPACEGRGCPACGGVGFSGRTGVFELLVVDELLRSAIRPGTSLDDLRTLARRGGMRSLADEAQRLVRAGKTTLAEMQRVIAESVE